MNLNFKDSLVKEEHISKHVLSVHCNTAGQKRMFLSTALPLFKAYPLYMSHLPTLHVPSTYSTCPIYLSHMAHPTRPIRAIFYNAVYESIVRYGMAVWYGSLTIKSKTRLHRTVTTALKLVEKLTHSLFKSCIKLFRQASNKNLGWSMSHFIFRESSTAFREALQSQQM